MKYSLRSLMIAAILVPPLLAVVIATVQHEFKKRDEREEIRLWLERYDRQFQRAEAAEAVIVASQPRGPSPVRLLNPSAPAPNP